MDRRREPSLLLICNSVIMKYLHILLTLAIASVAAPQAKADSTIGTPITSLPAVISKSGKYIVKKPLVTASNGAAIFVAARDVVIDLNGFSLTGTPDGRQDNVGIVVTGSNVVIRNGTIRRFNTAISDVVGANGTLIEDVICISQVSTGVRLLSTDTLLRRVTIRNPGAQDNNPSEIAGISLSGSSVVEHCVVQNIPVRAGVTSNVGIRLAGGSHVVRDTEIHRALGTGIAINADTSTICEGVRIRECGTGLTVAGGQIPLVRDSTIRDCIASTLGTFDDGGRNQID